MSTIAHAEAHANDGDQKSHHEESATRFEEGKEGSHNLIDAKDERSIANNLAAAKAAEKAEAEAEEAAKQRKPTDAARAHGNEPSRGAKIDEQIEREEQEELERKGKA